MLTTKQYLKRVFFSYWGVLILLSPVITSFLVPELEGRNTGGGRYVDPRTYHLLFPLLIFVVACGWIGETEQKRAHKERLKNNPPPKRELKEGESLIDFLYENEHEEKM